MISQHQIARLVEAREYKQLIERILSNGRCRSQTVKRMLHRSDVAAIAGLGLALQRLSEITYRPAALADGIAMQLASLQNERGWFGDCTVNPSEAELAASAVALRGLLAYAVQLDALRLPLRQEIELAIDHGLGAIQRRAVTEPVSEHDAIGWAIVLWQLGDSDELRSRVDVDQLLGALDGFGVDILEHELCRYAHAMAA